MLPDITHADDANPNIAHAQKLMTFGWHQKSFPVHTIGRQIPARFQTEIRVSSGPFAEQL